MYFNKNRVRYTGYVMPKHDIEYLAQDWKAFLAKIPAYPHHRYAEKGIVYTAGGVSHVTCLWVSINELRNLGCLLPIEVWHLGNEISIDVMEFFEGLDVRFRDFQDLGPIDRTGVFLKPLAILHSSFREVLYIDSDNVCLRDPTYLFDIPEYNRLGTVFWPDYWITDPHNPIWKIIDSSAFDTPEQESGQLLVNKEMCWKELNLCLHFNMLEKYYYKLLYGDKDTFRFAWFALKTSFYMIPTLPGTCGTIKEDAFYGNTMLQHDENESVLFLHRNLLKWDITRPYEKSWQIMKRFEKDAVVKEALLKKLNGKPMIDLDGDTQYENASTEITLLEEKCLNYLRTWRNSVAYFSFYEHMHFVNQRYTYSKSFSLEI
ncbi:hypothetical protein FAZ19_00100 [Sphingobacterium alkalisoli]|uniref:Uncharacterized protein n=2 Tax=Sphingobacterium alkalisoli TaxID=1874115 RepID=A0A4U0H773_9SPHI|nr:hypothetical protein FAZ19_00100 [Sphingobacterium alkalisoli]GGH11886.1 hypothetical protein GCM10011418_11070 [Sphingobacterium alkalisoli]